MRKALILVSILISSYTTGYGQIIKGTVYNQSTKIPIENALVYFNGTSVGTYTDKNGNFILDISKNISMPLTVSALAYNSITISDFSNRDPLLIELTPKIFELKEVIVIGKGNPQARKANFALFRRVFLGTTPNSLNCEIINENDITLVFNSKDETLRAFSSKPIIIKNKALGYKLYYYLNKFEYCKTNNKLFLLGNYIFTDEPTLNKIQQQKFERRRETSYLGSRMHFFRALWENKLDAEGFIVKDSAGIRLTYDKLVVQADSLNISSSQKYLNYRGKLCITYGKKLIGSSILITKQNVYFDKMGFFDPSGIEWEGGMANQLIADLLPFEYSLSDNWSTKSIQSLQQNTIKQNIPKAHQTSERSQLIKSIDEYVQSYQEPPYEKIFIHTDRLEYMQGDTIWFKVYLWYGPDQIPDTASGILYVNLINAEGKTQSKKKLLIHEGTSWGDFSTDSTISPGKYTIHAYTRWMLNQNTGNPFSQTITINPISQNLQFECVPAIVKNLGNDSLKINLKFYEIDKSGYLKNTITHNVNYSLRIEDKVLMQGQLHAVNTEDQFISYSLGDYSEKNSSALLDIYVDDTPLSFKKQFRIPLIDNIDVQFFPEGGRLVNGLQSKVAFKAIGTDGLSRDIKGIIETAEGDSVTAFTCAHRGMGSFYLNPLKDERYFARILHENRNYIIPLPAAQEDGSVMAITYPKDGMGPVLTLKHSPAEGKTRKYIVGSSYGDIRFSALLNLNRDSVFFRIPLEMLPEGVCRLTLLNHDFEPECERLIYVDNNRRIKIEILTDSSSYTTRSKVTFFVKATEFDGTPVQADLSIAVIDKEQVAENSVTGGISSYKYLESEVKGFIEDPDFYFLSDSRINNKKLDLLLLTQGYRTFLSKRLNVTNQRFLPETVFDFSGRIKLNPLIKIREKRFDYRQVGLTLMYPYFGETIFEQLKTDSLGKFIFDIPLFEGKSTGMLQATGSKNKPIYAVISLDEKLPLPEIISPVLQANNFTFPSVENIQRLQSVKKTEASKDFIDGAKVLMLPEVSVTAKAKNWYKDFEHNAEKIANLDSLDPTGNKYESLYDLLIREFGAHEYNVLRAHIKTIFLPCISYGLGPDSYLPIYVINGSTYFDGSSLPMGVWLSRLNYINYLPVNEIKRIMVIPPGDFSTYYKRDPASPLLQSVVYIETYSNLTYRGDPKGVKTFLINGLDAPRQFYSPRYDGSEKNNPMFDGRTTIYWNPSVRTDTAGNAKVDFYTGDKVTPYLVIVNGIEITKGITGQNKMTINY
jgi:hypothetical protein